MPAPPNVSAPRPPTARAEATLAGLVFVVNLVDLLSAITHRLVADATVVRRGGTGTPPARYQPGIGLIDPPRMRDDIRGMDGRLLLGAEGSLEDHRMVGLVVVDPQRWTVERRVARGTEAQVMDYSPDGHLLTGGRETSGGGIPASVAILDGDAFEVKLAGARRRLTCGAP